MLSEIFRKKYILLHLIFIIVPIFLFINASAVFGDYYAQMAKDQILIYLVLFSFVLVAAGVGLPKDKKFGNGVYFGMTFIVTAVILLVLPFLQTIAGAIQPFQLVLAFGLLFGGVTTYIEEVVFRYGIGDKLLGGSAGKGWIQPIGIIQALIFGAFHFAITGGNVYAMVFLSGLGYIWWLVYQKYGILGASGSHLAYNLASFGVLGAVI